MKKMMTIDDLRFFIRGVISETYGAAASGVDPSDHKGFYSEFDMVRDHGDGTYIWAPDVGGGSIIDNAAERLGMVVPTGKEGEASSEESPVEEASPGGAHTISGW